MRRMAWAAALALAAAGCESTGQRVNEPLLAKADDLYLQESYSQAAGHYDAFLADNPGYERRAELRARIGRCYLATGRADRAIDSFDRALASQPSPAVRADALFRKGIALRVTGSGAKALEAMRGVPRADLDRAGITADEFAYEHALALFRAGDWAGGQAELARVAPAGPFGARARTRLGMSGYAVQLGAFAEESQARSAAGRAPGAIVRAAPGAPPLHLVCLGSHARYEDAQREADRLRTAGFPEAFVIP
jgi:tetratricopeptide (TPR) repeat protein